MSLPIPKHADLGQVERIRQLVEGRTCVVVGSAPLPTPTADVNICDVVIAVNGGISSLQTERIADLWVLNSKLQDKPGERDVKPMHRAMIRQGAGRAAGHLLMLRGPVVQSESFTLATLAKLGASVQTWSVLDKVTKLAFEMEHCGRVQLKRPCSAGLLTVAMALVLGAESVRMVGISLKPGYHYLPHELPMPWWRDHIEADKLALRVLSERYGDRLSGALVRREVAA